MRKKSIHILLLEKSLSEARFVRDALAELDEMQPGNSWLGAYELTHVVSWEEASLVLQNAPFDVILANLWLEDSQGLDTLQRLCASAPAAPVVALTPKEDPALAIRLLQEGAADVLVQNELDCSPLGRALRGAYERHRRDSRWRTLAVRDELSGLLNFAGFLQLGDLLAQPLARSNAPAHLAIVRLEDCGDPLPRVGRHEEASLLLECAEILRQTAQDGDLAAYLGNGLFAWLGLRDDPHAMRTALERRRQDLSLKLLRRGHPYAPQIRIGLAPFSAESDWNLSTALEVAERESWSFPGNPGGPASLRAVQ